MGWQGRLYTGLFAISIAFFGSVKILNVAGLEAFESNSGAPRAAFSRKECLDRHQNYYMARNPDMLELNDELISRIARQCAVEAGG
jgi:hypothetical protein